MHLQIEPKYYVEYRNEKSEDKALRINKWKKSGRVLKEGKDPKDARSNSPVALTKILCKIFERKTNKRLFL